MMTIVEKQGVEAEVKRMELWLAEADARIDEWRNKPGVEPDADLAYEAAVTRGKLYALRARLAADAGTKPGLTRFLPGLLTGEFQGAEVRLAPWQGSGDMITVARANCWLVTPPDRPHIPAGEDIGVVLRP